MKLMSNFLSATILASSLVTFSVPKAIASDLGNQNVIKSTFAEFTMNLNSSKVENTQVILRQELSKASVAFAKNNVSTKDLIEYAVSDMNPAEEIAFRKMVDSIAAADLSTPEGEELLQKILMSQSKGSNFMPCGSGFFTTIFVAPIALILGVVAIDKFSDVTRKDRQDLEKEKAFIESEITILKGEGVSEGSYLITSRRAELVQIEIENQQMLDDKAKDEKTGMIVGAVAGAMALTVVVALMTDDCGMNF